MRRAVARSAAGVISLLSHVEGRLGAFSRLRCSGDLSILRTGPFVLLCELRHLFTPWFETYWLQNSLLLVKQLFERKNTEDTQPFIPTSAPGEDTVESPTKSKIPIRSDPYSPNLATMLEMDYCLLRTCPQ